MLLHVAGPISERRSYVRYVLWFPVTLHVEQGKLGCICRDAGPGGMLVSSPVPLEAGSAIRCQFRLSLDTKDELVAEAKVLRCERNADELELVFPHRIAITFDPPRLDLEEHLRHAQTTLRQQSL
jgi:hypothetical protein